ncbi:hypothetical protein KM295_11290 [Natronomonas sp. F2-12]|jgi:hypothetical protein|uniref:Uncharacterized protein n=1 Tax=Natronomonas aquatica TaxID=2841590 RepID=A0A9R1CV10_9EURY|nr:hypothetical protein [Natronomonas aquatica]MCQ4334051.1 hypothetical protein [Natronomonas aquatica]
MPLSNRHGTPIDPVPFAVVSGLGCMLTLSLGPLYGQAFGLSLPVALLCAAAVSVAVVVGSFYWQVWDAYPPAETSVEIRAERLLYGALAFGVLLLGLTLPLFLR